MLTLEKKRDNILSTQNLNIMKTHITSINQIPALMEPCENLVLQLTWKQSVLVVDYRPDDIKVILSGFSTLAEDKLDSKEYPIVDPEDRELITRIIRKFFIFGSLDQWENVKKLAGLPEIQEPEIIDITEAYMNGTYKRTLESLGSLEITDAIDIIDPCYTSKEASHGLINAKAMPGKWNIRIHGKHLLSCVCENCKETTFKEAFVDIDSGSLLIAPAEKHQQNLIPGEERDAWYDRYIEAMGGRKAIKFEDALIFNCGGDGEKHITISFSKDGRICGFITKISL